MVKPPASDKEAPWRRPLCEDLRGTYIPPPNLLQGILSAERVRPKSPVAGRRPARRADNDGNIYEWDNQH
jgi:hypothetical protein